MSRLLLKTLRKLVMLVAKANNKLPAILEIELQRMQGKGTGDSVEVEAKTALEFITRYGITEPVVLDIGANIGSYSEAILRVAPRATVFAFEPSSAARRKLEGRFLGSNSV